MGKNKIYAVAKGRQPGVYFTWDECKEQIDKFPGAIYRSFDTFDEADQYLDDNDQRINKCKYIVDDSQLTIEELCKKYNTKDKAICFVDGSFHEQINMYSYGGIIICNGRILEFSASGNDEELLSMRNVAGEILGSQAAMQICLNNKIPELNLFYDYEGIEKWCTGAWKTNKEGTKAYKKYYDSIKDTLTVNFIKVKGHTGVELNERVDKLAKKALGLN
jgi:ribonuclease HI